MPQFYFHFIDGVASVDSDGLDLADVAAAHLHAWEMAHAHFKAFDGLRLPNDARVLVTDADNKTVLTVQVNAFLVDASRQEENT